MSMTWVWVYLGAWAATTMITFGVTRRLGDRTRPVRDIFTVSVLAGAVWPFLLIGVVELSSMAVYSTAETLLVIPDPEPVAGGVVVPIR